MMQALVLKGLKSVLRDPEIKQAIFKAVDKAVKDTKTPIDDRAAELFKSFYDTIVASI